jgi:hypothetical protein
MSFADPVVYDRGDHGPLPGVGRLLLYEGGHGNELVLGEVQPLPGAGHVEPLGLYQVLAEHPVHDLRRRHALLEVVAPREQVALCGLYRLVFEKGVAVVRPARGGLELPGRYLRALGHRPGRSRAT